MSIMFRVPAGTVHTGSHKCLFKCWTSMCYHTVHTQWPFWTPFSNLSTGPLNSVDCSWHVQYAGIQYCGTMQHFISWTVNLASSICTVWCHTYSTVVFNIVLYMSIQTCGIYQLCTFFYSTHLIYCTIHIALSPQMCVYSHNSKKW